MTPAQLKYAANDAYVSEPKRYSSIMEDTDLPSLHRHLMQS